MKKRLIVFSDGTWQKMSADSQTNVVKLMRMVQHFDRSDRSKPIPQIVYYNRGVGSDRLNRIRGGAFGKGVDENIMLAYLFLGENYVEGDEIFLFGFSRGAYTVRSLAGLIYCSGLVRRETLRWAPRAMQIYRDPKIRPGHEDAIRIRRSIFWDGNQDGRVPITFLGCWDTVGSLGLPKLIPYSPVSWWFNRSYQFHDTVLNKSVKRAAHAIALDEIREPFDVTLMQKDDKADTHLAQKWFPGDHGSVGGGTEQTEPLADAALLWMMNEASDAGLTFDQTLLPMEQRPNPDPKATFDNRLKGVFRISGKRIRSVRGFRLAEDLHESVFDKLIDDPVYAPESLAEYGEKLEQLTAIHRSNRENKPANAVD